MAHAFFVAFNALISSAVLISGLLWLQFFLTLLAGARPKFDPRIGALPRRRPFWTAADFLVTFGIFFLAVSGLGVVFVYRGWLPSPSTSASGETVTTTAETTNQLDTLFGTVSLSMLSGLLAMMVGLAFVLLSRRDKWNAITELGFTTDQESFREGVRQGLWACLWLLPPVGLISLFVSLMIPYEHQVLDTLAALAAEPSAMHIALLLIGTAVVTPMTEEFMFRVLLQGGLQGMIDRPENETFGEESWTPRSWWPIVVTSVLFAMVHLGQGAAPVPLFFLSLGLGYLYRQTGSILPPLVVHMVLNGTTLVVEFTRLLSA